MAGRHARPSRAQARAGAFGIVRQPVSERVRGVRRRKALRRAKHATTGAALLSSIVLVGVVAGGGTYALWQGESQYDAGTVIPADLETSIRFATGDPENATASFGNLLPGESKTIPIVLENDGDLEVDVAAEIIAVTGSGYELRLELDAACTTSGFLSSPFLTGAALALDTPVALGEITDGDTATLCVQVTADAGITPSSAMTFDVVIAGDSGS